VRHGFVRCSQVAKCFAAGACGNAPDLVHRDADNETSCKCVNGLTVALG
jgi:hypothetical protein